MRNLTGEVVRLGWEPFALGGLADIYTGQWTRSDGETEVVAIKVIRARFIRARSTYPDDLKKLKRRVIKEAHLWSRLSHPHIVPFLGVSYDPRCPELPSLISPYYSNGSVCAYLRNNPEVDSLDLVCQIAAGLSYLHSSQVRIIHGDIKASNILVNDAGQALLIDFGLSRLLDHSGLTSNAGEGTYRWMAPELFKFSGGDDDGKLLTLTTATDIWAFSMTILEMFTGRVPFCHLMPDATVPLALTQNDLPRRNRCPEVSPEIWAILHQCWTSTSPHRRPSMHALSLTFNVLSASQRASRSLPAPDLLAILDALERKESEWRMLRLLHSEREGWITNPLLLAGEYYSERRGAGDGCANRKRCRRWTTLDNRAMGKYDDGGLFPFCPLDDAPYPCHWPSCGDRFISLVQCQDHESQHVAEEVEFGAFDT